MNNESAVNLAFQNGNYPCRIHYPSEREGIVDLDGELILNTDEYPRVELNSFCKVPFKPGEDGKGTSFPQIEESKAATGTLSSGASVLLARGNAQWWLFNQGRITGLYAILSNRAFDPNHERTYDSVRFQIEGLESFFDIAAIQKVKFPRDINSGTWSAVIDNEANKRKWEDNNAAITYSFDGKMKCMDAFEFHLHFSPVLQIKVIEPLTADKWWQEWIVPIRSLLSMLVDSVRTVTFVEPGYGRDQNDQLFGFGISQGPYDASRQAQLGKEPPFVIKEEQVDFLKLVNQWKAMLQAQEPLATVYVDLLFSDNKQPRSCFLSILQALEGEYNLEHKDEFEQMKINYSATRENALQEVCESEDLNKDSKQFIKKHLMKYPQQGLETALCATFNQLPLPEIRQTIKNMPLIKKILDGNENATVERALTQLRNNLSHGSESYNISELQPLANVFKKIARSELLRLLNMSETTRETVLK